MTQPTIGFGLTRPWPNLANSMARKLEESEDEIRALAFTVFDYFGISRTEIISGQPVDLDFNKITPIMNRLNQHEPIQYILSEAWFYGRKFFVDPSVLIPRSETELIVDQAKKIFPKKPIQVLDIGTGSGCIAISLALEFPQASVLAIDVSGEALTVAKRNASDLKANVQFQRLDILKEYSFEQKFDLIVSNPPYVSSEEKSSMLKNVLDHEPHLALFVPEHDPLIFYKVIAKISVQALSPRGAIVVEINERFADGVKSVFVRAGFKYVQLVNDLGAKNRIVVAQNGR
jgi:release factor glutamine methyltransferase